MTEIYFSPSSGSWKTKIKVSGGLVSSKACSENLIYVSLLVSGGLLEVFGIL